MITYSNKVFGRQTSRFERGNFFDFRKQRGAFTLIELLVIVAIIGVLGSLLLPALARSKSRAQAIMCMNYKKNLALAWTMYSDDNNARLAYNLAPSPQTLMMASPALPNWVNNVMDWELTPGDTNLNFVSQSILAPYAGFSAAIFRCPADTTLSSVQRNSGWSARVRSISMNSLVGNPGGVLQDNADSSVPGYQQFIKEADFRDPSSIFVFLDEHPDSISGGFFQISTNLDWVNLPASYHNGGGSFSYADGHTEIHRWQCASTVWPSTPEAIPLPIQLTDADRADHDWVLQHSSFGNQ